MEKLIRVIYAPANEVLGTIRTNRSITVEEALWCLGYDVNSEEDRKAAYDNCFLPAYIDDDGNYSIDTENIDIMGE